MLDNQKTKAVGLEMKKIGISTLKGWDLNVKHNLQVQKNILDNLFERLENQMRQSLQKF